MAKLVVFGAFLIALLAVAQASWFTVTTTVTEEQEQQQQQQQQGSCVEQMAPQSLRLRACQQFFLAPFERSETGEQHLGLQHDKEECCNGLKMMSEQCRCEAMSAVVYDIEKMTQAAEQGPGPQQGHQRQMEGAVQRIREMASNFPAQCNIGGPQKCNIPQPRLIRMFA